jgi:hypothetical protein
VTILLLTLIASILIIAIGIYFGRVARKKSWFSVPMLMVVAAYVLLLVDVIIHVLVDYGLAAEDVTGYSHVFDHSLSAIIFIVGIYMLWMELRAKKK